MSATTLGLRQTWSHACANLPGGQERLGLILDEGLTQAETEGNLSEENLLKLIEIARTSAAEALPPAIVAELNLSLCRAVYEYLLAVDAATVMEVAPAGVVASAQSASPPASPSSAPLIGIEEVSELEKTKSQSAIEPSESHRDLIRSASAAVRSADSEQANQHRSGKRFGLFHRGNGNDGPDAAEDDGAGHGSSQNLVVASQDGFHIGHPGDLVQQAPTAAATPEATSNIEPLVEPEPGPPTPPAVTTSTSAPDITQARRDIDERLRRKRCDDAAALLQQLAQEIGGREVAELAVDAGDRCRGLGKRRAATNSYLAAARADPVFATPLLRLADICIDDKDIDLAVSYLERVARLSRLSGDLEGALRVYRKIAAVAPYREDILELLLRAQTTGRIDT